MAGVIIIIAIWDFYGNNFARHKMLCFVLADGVKYPQREFVPGEMVDIYMLGLWKSSKNIYQPLKSKFLNHNIVYGCMFS